MECVLPCSRLPEINAAGAWVAQWVKQLTIDFGSGHDLEVLGSSPVSGSVLRVELA